MYGSWNAVPLLVVILCASTVSRGSSSEAPGFIWEDYDQRDGVYYHVEPLPDGSCIAAGKYLISSSTYPGVVKYDCNGQEVWSWEADVPSGAMTSVQPLGDGTLAAVGGVPPFSGMPSYQLLVILSADGDEMSRFWWDFEEQAAAYSVVQLPGGDFVIGGTILLFDVYTPTLTRVTPDGDVVWSIEPDVVSGAVRKVLMTGQGNLICMIDPSYEAPVVIAYTPDGEPLWTCDCTGYLIYGDGDMCCVPSENGYAVVSRQSAMGIDSTGAMVWVENPTGYYDRELYSIAPTMDGGLILSGADHYYEVWEPYAYHAFNGWLVKTDSQGNCEWNISRDPGSGHTFIYCARQFETGGYIVSGSNAGQTYLARLEPETGIHAGTETGFSSALVSNPFHSVLEVSVQVANPGEFRILVHDLTGRLQEEINAGFLPAGDHTLTCRSSGAPDVSMYLVRVVSGDEQMVHRAVRL